MARTLTSGMVSAFAAGIVRPIQLLELEFDGGTSYVTTCPVSKEWGGNLYVGKGEALSVDRIVEGEQLGAFGVRIALSGVPATLISNALAEHYQGRGLTVRQALCDADHDIIADPAVAWSGYMDTMAIELGETATITLTGAHRLADLRRPRGGRYNNGDQTSRFAGDKYFEFLEELQNSQVIWGYPLQPSAPPAGGSYLNGYQTAGTATNDSARLGYNLGSSAAKQSVDTSRTGYRL